MKTQQSMKAQQSGFTLIELIMVIVILGILAATALPKFVDLGSDARTSVMKGVEGSMRAANTIIYAKAAVANQLASTGTVTINGSTVSTVYGFAATVSPDMVSVMDLSPAADFTTAGTTIKHAGATTPATCIVTYTPATSTATPTYVTNVAGC